MVFCNIYLFEHLIYKDYIALYCKNRTKYSDNFPFIEQSIEIQKKRHTGNIFEKS